MDHAPTHARPFRLSLPTSDAAAERAGLRLVLLVALAVRLWIVATHTYVVWPDETFQYLEPAHRLVFGSGVITWEFFDGVRSWFLPGVLAGVMWLTSLVDPNPQGYLLACRLLCVVASLSVPFVGFRLAARRFGPVTALLAGLLCALSTEAVYFAPVIMTEPLATDAALLAIWFGDDEAGQRRPTRRLMYAGLLFGLAASLRYQYAPILGVVALVQHARRPRDFFAVAAAGLAVVLPVLGVLDWLTWGAPFQSVWLGYLRNAAQGISGAMGTAPWFYYGAYYLVAWSTLATALLLCAIYGATRAPLLGLIVLLTIGLHSLTPHKEARFVFLATACMPMLVGIGLGSLLQRFPRLRPMPVGAPVAALLALGISAATALTTYSSTTTLDAWHRIGSMLQATAAARADPEACGLGIRSVRVYESGGYTYWHRDLPIYYEIWDEAQELGPSGFRVRLASVLAGRPVRQYPSAALAANTDKFNVMIGTPDDGFPGFARGACYGRQSMDEPVLCVFTRPGGCQ